MRSERATIARGMLVVAFLGLVFAAPRALSRSPGVSSLGLTVGAWSIPRKLLDGPDRAAYWLAFPMVAALVVLADAAWCETAAGGFVAGRNAISPAGHPSWAVAAERRATAMPLAAADGCLLGLAGLAVDRARRRSEPWALAAIAPGGMVTFLATTMIFVKHVFGAFD